MLLYCDCASGGGCGGASPTFGRGGIDGFVRGACCCCCNCWIGSGLAPGWGAGGERSLVAVLLGVVVVGVGVYVAGATPVGAGMVAALAGSAVARTGGFDGAVFVAMAGIDGGDD